MSIIAIASQKGGVGKSMLAIHIAAEAARKKKRTVILELDRQGTISLLWNKRRVENFKPDDMLKSVDSFTPQPEVRRAESVTLEQTIAELRGAGVQLIVLDLPGTHSPAINKAIGIADITLIPTRPRDVDLQPSIETADAARRANKPFALHVRPGDGPANCPNARHVGGRESNSRAWRYWRPPKGVRGRY
jgi:chromosome partitioning protein